MLLFVSAKSRSSIGEGPLDSSRVALRCFLHDPVNHNYKYGWSNNATLPYSCFYFKWMCKFSIFDYVICGVVIQVFNDANEFILVAFNYIILASRWLTYPHCQNPFQNSQMLKIGETGTKNTAL